MTTAAREGAAGSTPTDRPRDLSDPRSARPSVLRGGRRFAAVRAWRNQVNAGVVRVSLAPNPVGVARVGLAITGIRLAVDRNRLRRRLRAALRPHLLANPGMDIVVVAGAPAAAAAYTTLVGDLARGVGSAATSARRRMTQAQ